MNTICSLMERIFAFDKMKYFSYTNPITCGNDCRFVVFITILA